MPHLGHQIVKELRQRVVIPKLHADFIIKAFSPWVEVAALSVPRGNAKTWLVGQLTALSLRPGSCLFQPDLETLIVSGSLEQSRVIVGFVREALEDVLHEYRFLDSGQRLQVTHKPSHTKLRVLSSSGKRAMGLARFGFICGDEPGAWETRGGRLMFDALRQSLGKRPGQRLILIGTRAPAEPDTWWPDLLKAGTDRQTGLCVSTLQAEPKEAWDDLSVIKRVNPMMRLNRSLAKTIKKELKQARENPSLRRSFEAFRLNRLVEVEHEMLVEVEQWQGVEARPVPPRVGRPILAIDLGAHRSWSAAWAIWRNGRSECYALCGSIPSLAEREKEDGVPGGLYAKLHEEGTLLVDEGVRVARPEVLIEHLLSLGINPEAVFADRFMLEQLQDIVGARWKILLRRTRWSEATMDVTGFRRLVSDGPLSIAEKCRTLAKVSLSQAVVVEDEGNLRIKKRRGWKSRDDVAVCATLAAGALVRYLSRTPRRGLRYARVSGSA